MNSCTALSLWIALLAAATGLTLSAMSTTGISDTTRGAPTQTSVYILSNGSSTATSELQTTTNEVTHVHTLPNTTTATRNNTVTTTEGDITTAASNNTVTTTEGDTTAVITGSTTGHQGTATVTKLLSSTVKSTSTTAVITTTTTRSPTTEEKKKISIELEFIGSASRWSQPRMRICIRCSAKKKVLINSQCYNVTDIQITTNRSSENDYNWRTIRLHQGCERIEFHWQAEWLVGGKKWGYVNNSKLVSDWRNEMTAGGQAIIRHIKLRKYQHCQGPLIITTSWQKTDISNITCGPPSYTTQTTAPSNTTEPPGGVPTGTRPPVTIIDKFTNPDPAVSILKKEFGKGPVIAIVVCSLVVLIIVVVATVCGVRSFNNKRRRYRRDMNYDDLDTNSIAFESVPISRKFNSLSESKTRLYSPLTDNADNDDDEQTVYSNMYTSTGEVEDVHHRSGGGISTVYEDPRLKSISSTSSNHPLADI